MLGVGSCYFLFRLCSFLINKRYTIADRKFNVAISSLSWLSFIGVLTVALILLSVKLTGRIGKFLEQGKKDTDPANW